MIYIALVGIAVVAMAIWLAFHWGDSRRGVKQAESESEERARDAEEAAKPMSTRPLTGPGGMFDD